MTITPNYYMNIARQYNDNRFHHYCDVELGCIGEETALERYAEFCNRFPKVEGWLIELNYVDCRIKEIATSN